MEENYRNALCEISEIIKYSDDIDKEMISRDFLDFVEENKSRTYKSKITTNKPLENQDILYETRVILAEMYREFWSTDEEKRVITQRMKLYEKLEREKYMPQITINDDIFGSNAKPEENIKLAKRAEKNSIFYKIINFIKNIMGM